MAAVIIGFLLNHKNFFAKICAFWVGCSILLLGIIGWGSAENGMVLYALYFSWAYVSLLFMLVEKLFAKFKTVRYIIYSASIVALIIINLPGMYEIIEFGIKYYPVK